MTSDGLRSRQDWLSKAAFLASAVARSLWLLLLPRGKRQATELVASFEHLPPWSALLGFVEMLAGALIGFDVYIKQVRAFSASLADHLLVKQSVTADDITIYYQGPLAFLSVFLHPLAWLALYLVVEGVGRFSTWAVSDRAPGALVICSAVWLQDRLRAAGRRRARRRQLGAPTVDRIEWERSGRADWSVRVLCNREKPWSPALAVELSGLLYQLVRVRELRQADRRMLLAYELRPWPPGAVVRGVTAYYPPLAIPPGPSA